MPGAIPGYQAAAAAALPARPRWLWLIRLVAAGTAIFGFHHPAPVNASGNAQFNPFFYTLDLLLPIFSYGQQ
jgi:hypothetical protein